MTHVPFQKRQSDVTGSARLMFEAQVLRDTQANLQRQPQQNNSPFSARVDTNYHLGYWVSVQCSSRWALKVTCLPIELQALVV